MAKSKRLALSPGASNYYKWLANTWAEFRLTASLLHWEIRELQSIMGAYPTDFEDMWKADDVDNIQELFLTVIAFAITMPKDMT